MPRPIAKLPKNVGTCPSHGAHSRRRSSFFSFRSRSLPPRLISNSSLKTFLTYGQIKDNKVKVVDQFVVRRGKVCLSSKETERVKCEQGTWRLPVGKPIPFIYTHPHTGGGTHPLIQLQLKLLTECLGGEETNNFPLNKIRP